MSTPPGFWAKPTCIFPKFPKRSAFPITITFQEFSKSISNLLREKNKSIKTITLKYKTSSFENHTRSKTLKDYVNEEEDIIKVANEILNEEEFFEDIRLIGLSVSSFKENLEEQISLF